jgi:hypothetical protein
LSPCLRVFAIGLDLEPDEPEEPDEDLDLDLDLDLDFDFGDFDLDLDFELGETAKSANVSLPLSIIYYIENIIYYLIIYLFGF